jgi:hypothetical protein
MENETNMEYSVKWVMPRQIDGGIRHRVEKCATLTEARTTARAVEADLRVNNPQAVARVYRGGVRINRMNGRVL